jgi:long-chain acyl-CoA synthetase
MQAGTATAGTGERLRAIGAPTMCAAFQATVADYPDLPALRTPGGGFEITWAQYGERVRRTAAGLAALGVGRGDTLGLMLTNRPDFHWVDSAAMHLGATAFSIYNTSAPEQIEYLLGDAGNRVLVTEAAFLDRVLAARERCPSLEHIVVVDPPFGGQTTSPTGTVTLDEVDAGGDPAFDFDAAWRSVAPEDVLTLIYTSGTTGPPKGVQITHANMMAMVQAIDALDPTPAPGHRAASYLPMAHIAERGFSHYHGIPRAYSVTSVPEPAAIFGALGDIRPTRFVGVPRVWEKLKAALEAGMAAEADESKRKAVEWAFDVGRRRVRAEQAGEPVDADLAAECARADELVFGPLRQMLGFGELDIAFVGAAPTPVEVLEFFFAMGIEICEVWGMSETSAVITANPRGQMRIGTVGRVLPTAELRLAPDGEILVRGPMVMPGYRNAPEKTSEVLDADGWLATGDIGTLDDDGYLRIVDRKKELIINAAGKNMSPANIEARLKAASPLIAHAVCIGDGRPYNVALIVLERAPTAQPLVGAAGRDPRDPATVADVQAAVDTANAQLSRVEQIKKFEILEDDWAPGGDELTPTMKLKRKPIAEKYAAQIEALYAG